MASAAFPWGSLIQGGVGLLGDLFGLGSQNKALEYQREANQRSQALAQTEADRQWASQQYQNQFGQAQWLQNLQMALPLLNQKLGLRHALFGGPDYQVNMPTNLPQIPGVGAPPGGGAGGGGANPITGAGNLAAPLPGQLENLPAGATPPAGAPSSWRPFGWYTKGPQQSYSLGSMAGMG